jgi:TP901 family phage tail tape measure protein
MAAGTLVRRVMLQVTADDADAADKLESIKLKADELRDQFPELVARINTAEASAKLKVLKDELAQAAQQADAEPLDIRVNSAEAQAKLDAIKANAEELRALNPRLVPVIDDAEASAKLAVLRAELRETEDEGVGAAERIGAAWEATKYAMLGIAGGLAYGTYKGAGFEQAMTRISTQAGVSKGQLAGLSAQVLQLAGQVGEGPDSLAEALYHIESNMASLGAKGPQVMSALRVAAQGASVGGANLVDVTNALGAAIASGIPGVQNYQSAMGMLNATVGAGDMQMQDLAEALGTGFLSNVKIYGSTLNDVGAILATFGDNNIRGAHAGTQLRMSVQSLAVQASTATPYLKELGLSAGELGKYQSANGTVATINLLVQKLHEAGISANETGNIVTQLFGKKAGAGIAVLIDQVARLDSKQKVLTQGAKDFGAAWEQQSKTPQQQLKNLEAGSEALAISLGIKLLPAANKALGWANSFIGALQRGSPLALGFAGIIGTTLGLVALRRAEEGLKGVMETAEGGVKALGNFAAGFGSADKAASDATGAWGSVGGTVRGALAGIKQAAVAAAEKLGLLTAATEGQSVAEDGLAVAAADADTALDANPIGLVVLAVAALVIGIVELVKHWRGVVTGLREGGHLIAAGFDVVCHAVAAVGDWIKDHWKEIIAWLADPVGMAVHEILTHTHQIAHAFDEARHDVAHILDEGRHDIAAFADWVPRQVEHGYDVMRHQTAVAFDAWGHLTAHAIDDVVSFFMKLPGRVTHFLAGLPGDMLRIGKNVIDGLIHGIESAAADIPGIMKGLAGDVESYFTDPLKIFSPSRIFVDHGERDIGGALVMGIDRSRAAVRASMGRLAGTVQAGAPGVAGAHGAGGSSVLQVEWIGGRGADAEFITWLKKNIRFRGGDPGVLGR